MAQDTRPSIVTTDAVFVTALPEEFSAVGAHLLDRREQVEQGTLYELGLFEIDGRDYSVAVVQTGMGNAPSAAATERGATVPVVSSDIIGNPHSSIFDSLLTQSDNSGHCRVVSWYDNEWGYSHRCVNLIEKMAALG